jgi:hypothetical protein
MTDEPENLTLRYLRRIDEKIDRLGEDVIDMKARMQTVGTGLVDIRRDIVNLHADIVRIDHRLDRVEQPLGRIERRLDLIVA